MSLTQYPKPWMNRRDKINQSGHLFAFPWFTVSYTALGPRSPHCIFNCDMSAHAMSMLTGNHNQFVSLTGMSDGHVIQAHSTYVPPPLTPFTTSAFSANEGLCGPLGLTHYLRRLFGVFLA